MLKIEISFLVYVGHIVNHRIKTRNPKAFQFKILKAMT